MSLLKKIGISLIPLLMLCACSSDGGSSGDHDNDNDGPSNSQMAYEKAYYVRKSNNSIIRYVYFSDATTLKYVCYDSTSKEWNEAGAKTVSFKYSNNSIYVDNEKKGEFRTSFRDLSLYAGIAIDSVEEFTISGFSKPAGGLPVSNEDGPLTPPGNTGGENPPVTPPSPQRPADGYAFHSALGSTTTFHYPSALYSGGESPVCTIDFEKSNFYDSPDDIVKEFYEAEIRQGSLRFGIGAITSDGNKVAALESGKTYKCIINNIEFTINYTSSTTTLGISGFYDLTEKTVHPASGSIFNVEEKNGSYGSADGVTYRCKEFTKSTGEKGKSLTISVDNDDDVVKVTDGSGNSGFLIYYDRKTHSMKTQTLYKVKLGDKNYILMHGPSNYSYDAKLIYLLNITDSYDIGAVTGEDCRTGIFKSYSKNTPNQWSADNNKRVYEIRTKYNNSGSEVLGVNVCFYKFGTTAVSLDSSSLIAPYKDAFLYKDDIKVDNYTSVEDDVTYNFSFGTKKYNAVRSVNPDYPKEKLWTITSASE